MNNTKLIDIGFTYWIVSDRCTHSKDEVMSYIERHGYSPGDGTTFIIVDPILRWENEYVIPLYGDPITIARGHTSMREGEMFTIIYYEMDILNMTKYVLVDGKVYLDDELLSISPTDAAYSKGIQYNRGNTITTFRSLTSYILSKYNWDRVGMIICEGTSKYSVRKVSGGPLSILPGIILYERC